MNHRPFKPLYRPLRKRPTRHAPAATPLDNKMMSRALDLARLAASEGEVPVGAVVYETNTGTILGEGRNTRETDRTPWGHAEYLAIQNACKAIGDWRLNHCSLAVTLEPCPMCSGLIVNARVGRLIYGAQDPKGGGTRSLFQIVDDPRLNHRAQVITGLHAPQAAKLLKDFFKQRRKSKSTSS